jgi:hypothetical protein
MKLLGTALRELLPWKQKKAKEARDGQLVGKTDF